MASAQRAAEATYRAYTEAVNAVDLSDPNTFEPVYALTTGDANASHREEFSRMHSEKLTMTGTTKISTLIFGELSTSSPRTATIRLCLDVSKVEIVNPEGESAVSGDRPDVQPVVATLVESPVSTGGWSISSIDGRDGEPICAV